MLFGRFSNHQLKLIKTTRNKMAADFLFSPILLYNLLSVSVLILLFCDYNMKYTIYINVYPYLYIKQVYNMCVNVCTQYLSIQTFMVLVDLVFFFTFSAGLVHVIIFRARKPILMMRLLIIIILLSLIFFLPKYTIIVQNNNNIEKTVYPLVYIIMW